MTSGGSTRVAKRRGANGPDRETNTAESFPCSFSRSDPSPLVGLRGRPTRRTVLSLRLVLLHAARACTRVEHPLDAVHESANVEIDQETCWTLG